MNNPYEKQKKDKLVELSSKQQVFDKIEHLYHVTCAENLGRIQNCGLLTRRFPDNEYHVQDEVKRAIVCFCAKEKLQEHIDSVSNKCGDIVICRISAKDALEYDFGLDWTFDGTQNLTGDKWEQIRSSLLNLGSIAIYENISFDKITMLDRELNSIE